MKMTYHSVMEVITLTKDMLIMLNMFRVWSWELIDQCIGGILIISLLIYHICTNKYQTRGKSLKDFMKAALGFR